MSFIKPKFGIGDTVTHKQQYTYKGGLTEYSMTERKVPLVGTIKRVIDLGGGDLTGAQVEKLRAMDSAEYVVAWELNGEPYSSKYADEACLIGEEVDEAYIFETFGVVGKPGYTNAEREAFQAGWDAAMKAMTTFVESQSEETQLQGR